MLLRSFRIAHFCIGYRLVLQNVVISFAMGQETPKMSLYKETVTQAPTPDHQNIKNDPLVYSDVILYHPYT